METDFYIRLTLAVYKVTELFPEDEPLKFKIRELANEILADLIIERSVSDKIEAMENHLSLAENQNWIDPRNFLVLRREYSKIREIKRPISKNRPNGRQKKIIELLKENGKIRVGELIKIFPGVNRRTLLRDLESFRRAGLVEKNGNGRGAHYIAKNAT